MCTGLQAERAGGFRRQSSSCPRACDAWGPTSRWPPPWPGVPALRPDNPQRWGRPWWCPQLPVAALSLVGRKASSGSKIEIDAPTRVVGASFGANTRVDAAHHYHHARARLDRDVFYAWTLRSGYSRAPKWRSYIKEGERGLVETMDAVEGGKIRPLPPKRRDWPIPCPARLYTQQEAHSCYLIELCVQSNTIISVVVFGIKRSGVGQEIASCASRYLPCLGRFTHPPALASTTASNIHLTHKPRIPTCIQ